MLHPIIVQFFKKLNLVDYERMYDVYKLLYKKLIFNSLYIYNTTN